ncbi:hypothetical protein [Phytomonospora endophytica]|uniref:DNA-binding protein n=1 Tax=Phytomonospora endophytica TaxID=714109 RepID=A0A841FMH9_9ACTN|nr:hypothetical protein [Phytomonospora endophytica]MBB6037215.1 hypothetical protein [Phytomonospora endophytica]GIG71284.1 hypothetical protein Pen01_75790 [Phytomonospora endophytica]
MTDTPPVTEDQVRARHYPHPAMSRPVVRLVPDAVAPATDVEMEMLGFRAPVIHEPSLTAPRRPLGYPGWALVNDPDNAAVALSAAKAMRTAAASAAMKPSIAVEAYDRIGATVPVTHLPALYEQAARDFLDRGREYWAGIFFSKAREVEIVHALAIDPHYRHLSYVEFAVAGAVTVKALKAYAGELSHGADPKEAYDTFLDLAMRRTKAGVPPWTGLVVQMKDLAKKAGMDVGAALEDIAADLLRLPATRRAPAGFWTAMTPVLLRLVGRDEEARRRIVELFPEERDWWWALLCRFDAAGSIVDVRDWLKRAHRHATGSYGNGSVPAELVALVPSLAPRVDEPVEVGTWANHYGVVDADLVEACVAAGMPVEVPDERVHFALGGWRAHTGLNTLGTLAEWRPLLTTSVTAYLRRESASGLLGHAVLRPIVDEVLHSWVARAENAGLADVEDVLDDLSRALADCPVSPALTAAIAAVDVDGALLRCLRAGIFDEYHWPALDEAVAELKTVTGHSSSWPVMTVWDEAKAIAVGPDGIIARYRFPAGQERYNIGVVYSDGQFLVRSSWGSDDHWSGSPQDQFDGGYVHSSFLNSSLGYASLNPDGQRLSAGEPLQAGSSLNTSDGNAPHVLSDGEAYWDAARPNEDGSPRRIDPKTGHPLDDQTPPARLSVPGLSGEERVLYPHSSLARLPKSIVDSPLGSAAGLAGAVVWGVPSRSTPYQQGDTELIARIRHVDGRHASVRTRARDQWWPHNLLGFPGGDWKVLTHQSNRQVGLAEPESGVTHWRVETGAGDGDKTSYCQAAAGSPLVPPPAFWHFLVPRTAAGSAQLRGIDAESVTTMLGTEEKYIVPVIETLLPGAERQIWIGVHGLVAHAAKQIVRRDKLIEVKAAAVPAVDASVLVNATKGVVHSDWGARYQSALEQIMGFGDLLAGRVDRLESSKPGFELRLHWQHLIGDIEAVAWRAANPAVDAESRTALLALLDVWAQTPFADPDVAVRVSTVDRNAYDAELSGGSLVSADTRYLRHEDIVISVGAAPTAIFATRETGPGWGTAERLRELSRLITENGPVPFDPEAAQAFADGTGLTLATASWLLITVPLYDSWPRDVERDKHLRDTVGIKAKALAPGRTEAERLGEAGVRDLYRGLLPEDPAELWAPGGMRALAERLAERYAELHGRRTVVAESTVEAMTAYNPSAAIGSLLEQMTAPHALSALTADRHDRIVWDDGSSTVEREGAHLSDLLSGLVRAMFTAYYALPAGDVVRASVPELARLIRARLTAPGLIFTASRRWSDSAEVASLRASLGGRPYVRADGKPVDDVTDTGALIVEFHGSYYDVFVRPALIGDTPEGRLARTLTTGWNDPLPIVDLARGDGLAGIVARIESGGLPDGAFEADPSLSAPELVAEVAAAHSLPTDAAALYLQLLALTEPTDRNIRRWNAWTPARHKKAQTALVDAGLVIEATRARAGRKVFIAGQWSALKTPMLPVETAKLDLYGDTPFGSVLPLRPIPDLFAEAWRRRRAGEG